MLSGEYRQYPTPKPAVANPYDDAQAENFMKTLKVEEVYRSQYETLAEVTARPPHFIEDVYNAK